MKIELILVGLLLAINSWGQKKITGLVFDRKEVLPGVIVTEYGTDKKVVTDVNGRFEITTETANPTLTFEFIGLCTRIIKIRKRTELKVKMKWEKVRGKHISMRLHKKQRLPTQNILHALHFGLSK